MNNSLGRRWIRSSFLGWTLGLVLGILFIIAVESIGIRDVQFPLAVGMGLGVGLVQAGIVAPHLGGRRPWIAASALGLAAPFLAFDLARLVDLAVGYSLTTAVMLGGLTVGVLQWRILRVASSRAAWWIVASALGWSLGAATVAINDVIGRPIPGIPGALLYLGITLIGGLALGAAGAVALPRILDDPPSWDRAADRNSSRP